MEAFGLLLVHLVAVLLSAGRCSVYVIRISLILLSLVFEVGLVLLGVMMWALC